MKTIYKYPLKTGYNELEIPYIKILNCINQNMIPTLYAVVDPTLPPKKIEVLVVGTGWDLEDNVLANDSNYLNTITCGIYVWHIFYKAE